MGSNCCTSKFQQLLSQQKSEQFSQKQTDFPNSVFRPATDQYILFFNIDKYQIPKNLSIMFIRYTDLININYQINIIIKLQIIILHILDKINKCILVNGNGESNMVEVFKYGKTDLFMKEIGYKVKHQGMVDQYIRVVIIIKDNGLIINVMVLENMQMPKKLIKKKHIVVNIMDIGSMITSKVMEFKSGPIKVSIREILRTVLKMVMANFNGKTVVATLVNSNKIKYLEEVSLFGTIKAVMMVNGKTILCMEKVHIFFQMAEIILEIMQTDLNKDLEHLFGIKEENMQENGKEENNTDKELIQIQEEYKVMEYGWRVNCKKQINSNFRFYKQIDIALISTFQINMTIDYDLNFYLFILNKCSFILMNSQIY